MDYLLTGSEAEDYPNLPFTNWWWIDPYYFQPGMGSRASHHFHDPMNPVHPGLDNHDSWARLVAEGITLNRNDLTGISAGNRAIGGPSPIFGAEDVAAAVPRNYFSWADARRYFKLGLTSMEPEARSHYLALTFLSLGHVMHLAEDMAVPSHTRNDMAEDHILSYLSTGTRNIEAYAKANKTDFINDLTDGQIPEIAAAELEGFWDQHGLLPLSLSEYANMNFLSRGTVFSGYGLPEFGNCRFSFDWDGEHWVAYASGTTTEGENVRHLARYSIKADMLSELLGLTPAETAAHMMLDDSCYEEYSNLLLPRAVANAAGVLEHFFRGRFDAFFGFDGGLTIVNRGADPMEGDFTLYFDSLSLPGYRRPIPGASWRLSVPAGGTAAAAFDFLWPSDLDPSKALTLVFEGNLGGEEGAVSARAFQAPNALDHWQISWRNDQSDFLQETYASEDTAACWVSLWRQRLAFAWAGQRAAYHVVRLYHDPEAGPPLDLSGGVRVSTTLLPCSTGQVSYQHPSHQDFGTVTGFLSLTNGCGDPEGSAAVAVTPGFAAMFPSAWYQYRGADLDLPSPLPGTVTADVSHLAGSAAYSFLTALHPGLTSWPLPEREETVWGVAALAAPDPEVYDVSWEHGIDLSEPGVLGSMYGLRVPAIWDIGNSEILVGGSPVQPADYWRSTVYGTGFRWVDETVSGSGRSVRRLLPDLANPFGTIYSVD